MKSPHLHVNDWEYLFQVSAPFLAPNQAMYTNIFIYIYIYI